MTGQTKTIIGAALGAALLALVVFGPGCRPKPDKSIVLWQQPAPAIAALAHAGEISGLAYHVAPTGSMEPVLSGGDWIVVDLRWPWEKLEVGDLVTYRASWLPADSAPVTHMLAAWNPGRASAVMNGIANPRSEAGAQSLRRADYIGKVVQVYTQRIKQ